MTKCSYVRNAYNVPAEIGRRVTVDGRPGVIAEDLGNYIGVLFDDCKPSDIQPCHPTWRVEYGEMGGVRRMTRSQARYRRYLEVSDCFDSFAEFLRYETAAQEAGE
ncbi:hypothetical protein [Algiphilus sp.]|uniref:hypothetical protein n=1 Tax=Algiphilus sp. TaxID=1872431 RepID=UPI003BA9C182